MKNLEDTRCEVKKITEIQASVKNCLNTSIGDEFGQLVGSPAVAKFSVSLGGFLEDKNYAWLSNGQRFNVISTAKGDIVASWTFRNKVTCAAQITTQPGERLLILVGLDNGATKLKDSSGMLCIFDCSRSHVLRAIRMPAGIEQVCVANGLAELEDFNSKETGGISQDDFGFAYVALRNLHHLVVDLRHPFWEEDVANFDIELSPCEIKLIKSKYFASSNRHRDSKTYIAYNLLTSDIEDFIKFDRDQFESSPLFEEKSITAIMYSKKLGCLISGCLGRIIIWHNDGSIGWISPATMNNMPVTHLALLEPSDDPKPFYYLWVAYQEDSFETPPKLQMYALLVERKYRDANLCFKVEGEPSLKFELHMDTNDKINGLMPIEKINMYEQSESSNRKGEESLLLIGMTEKALLFDLNQWYKEQMPRSLRECQNPNIFLSRYHMKSEATDITNDEVLSCIYVPSSIREFPCRSGNPLEELFYPRSLAFEWMELGSSELKIWATRGSQWELLREMAVAGPSILVQPSETFHRCLAAGLMPFNVECSFNSDENTQREMLLSLCLEQRWASFLIKCANEWVDGSVGYLFPMLLRWGAQRAASIKIVADQLCIPLFDQSGSTIGDTEIRILRYCAQQLECLSNVIAKLPNTSNDLTLQQRALGRVATHLGVLLWFYDVGLLPETHEVNEETLPITFSLQIPYPYERLAAIYRKKRESLRANDKSCTDQTEDLFIDELMRQECRSLRNQWECEGGDITTGGYYPPPSLQSLLRSFLLDCYQPASNEMENKHQITIYLLMDLVKLLQGSCPDVDQLIKYPAAFKLSPSLIKVTQAFWLLDHDDYQGFFDTLTGQLVSDSDVRDWHHRLVMRTLMRNKEYKLALTYLRVRKPPLSAIDDQSASIRLSVKCGLVQTAFHQRPPSHYRQLLSCFFRSCQSCGKLNEILHLALDTEEEQAFLKFLEDDKLEEVRLLYYLQRCHYTEMSNVHPISRSYLRNVQSAPLAMVNAYNAILPKVTKILSENLNKKHVETETGPRYPRPMSHRHSYNKTYGIYEAAIRKAKETYSRRETCQIPFISAPCTSLRLNNSESNSNCVVFPTLAQRLSGKRSLDEMSDGEMDRSSQDHIKRRKLCGVDDSFERCDSRRLNIDMALDTPLVHKKTLLSEIGQDPMETPHSILKIRQLIRGTTSSKATVQTSLEAQGLSKEYAKKPARQIRFSIGLPLEDSNKDEVDDTEADKSVGESEDVQVDETKDTNIGSDESGEAFYSPNASGKSNSTNDSNYSIASITGPRPRPSLRRSHQLSSTESLIETEEAARPKKTVSVHDISSTSSLTKTSTVSSMPSISESSPVQSNIPSCFCSIPPQSETSKSLPDSTDTPTSRNLASNNGNFGHRSFVLERKNRLPGDSDKRYVSRSEGLDEYSCRVESRGNEIRGRKPISVETRKSITFSFSSSTKTTVTKDMSSLEDDEDAIMEVDNHFGLDHEPEVSFVGEKELDNDLFGQAADENVELNCETMHQATTYDDSTTDNDVNHRADEIDDNSDGSKKETSPWEHQNEYEKAESFQSLTNSSFSEHSETPEEVTGHVPAATNTVDETNRESVPLSSHAFVENSNITEDESSNDIAEKNELWKTDAPDEILKPDSEKEDQDDAINAINAMQRKDKNLADNSNFTEDESVESSIDNFELVADDSEMEEEIHQEFDDRSKEWLEDDHKTNDATENNLINPTVDTKSIRKTDSGKSRNSNNPILPTNLGNLEHLSRSELKENQNLSRQSPDRAESPTLPRRTTRSRRTALVATDSELSEKSISQLSSIIQVVVPKNDISELPGSVDINEASNVTEPRKERRKRSVSRDKDSTLLTRQDDVRSEEADKPLRRSTRRAASVQKELSMKHHENSSTSNLTSNTFDNDANKVESISKKTRKAQKLNSSNSDPDALLASSRTRSSSVTKELKGDQLPTGKPTRRRGSSVPKELSTQTTRSRRSSSLMKDTIPEEETVKSNTSLRRVTASPSVEIAKNDMISSPATNTRSRSLSIQSIPEELEATFGIPVDQRSTSISDNVNTTKRSKGRAQRASSLEPSVSKPKRRTKTALAKSIIEETITEETTEDETVERSKTSTKGGRRKRTESASITKDSKDTSQMRIGRRNRRSKSEDSDVFHFSPPEVTSDSPIDSTNVQGVPPYVFSPPQLRSRHRTGSQERRELTHFVSPLTTEEKQSTASRIIKMAGKPRILNNPHQLSGRKFYVKKPTRKSSSS